MWGVLSLVPHAGFSPPVIVVQPAIFIYIRPTVRRYRYRNFYFTVTSHELRMRTIFIPAFHNLKEYLHVTTLRQRSLDEEREERLARRRQHRVSRHRARKSAKEREKRLSRRRAIALQREILTGSSTTESRSS